MHKPHHILHFLKNRELNELYMSIALRSFALSMISIFIPIYLLKLNYSLFSVLVFYIVLNSAHALFVIPAAKISSRFGFKHSIFFSIPVLIIFYLSLYTLEQYNWPLFILAIILGISNALFWIGHHIDFSKFSDSKNRGKEIGTANIISSVFYVIGPFIGGSILLLLGFKALFVMVSIILMVSIIPLFFSKDIYDPMNFTIKSIFKGQKIRDALTFMGHGIESGVGMTIWPIFIFFSILNNYLTLGLVSSLSLSFSLIFIFIVGKFSDIHRKLILKIGAVSNAIIWGIKSFVKTSLHVFVIDSFYGISQTLISIPFIALSYDKANEDNIVKFIIFREITIQIGRILLFTVMLFITDLIISFIFSGGVSFLYLLF